MTDDQRETLHDLNKAKVVFQARTVAAAMGFDPTRFVVDRLWRTENLTALCPIGEDQLKALTELVSAAYQRGLSDGKGEG